MRKPLVVVCVTASAVLLAGAIAATTAGADTTSDGPEVPGLAVPGMPGFDAGDDDPPGFDLPGLVAQAQNQADRDQADRDQANRDQINRNRDGWDQVDRDRDGRDQQGHQPPDGQRDPWATQPGQAGRPDRDRPGQQPGQLDPAAGPQRPAQNLPPAAADTLAAPAQAHRDPAPARDVRQPVRQVRPAADTVSAAQRNVTPSSVSNSVRAPVQQQVLALVNTNRQRGGCGSITLDGRLIAAANRHAGDMARRGYFAHESPNGERAGERVQDAGYRWERYGENIARGADSPYEVVDGWMHSPEHRENILDCRLTQMGVGLAFDREQTPYWVQNFATPR